MAQLLLTKLTRAGWTVYINPLDIISIERKERPNTTLKVIEQEYITYLTLKGPKTIGVEETPDEIVEAIKSSSSLNWPEEEEK